MAVEMSEHEGSLSGDSIRPVVATTLPESISWKVTNSWNLVSDKAEKVGVDFFLRLFEEHPQAADLFNFGGKLALGEGEAPVVPKSLRVHARKVMEAVGACVGGLTHLPDLVPILRTLGAFHDSLGVQHFHYDVVYKHLMDAMEAEIGPKAFDQDTREAWEIVYRSLTQVMKHPNAVLQMEPLEGWGICNAIACCYLVIFTPLQMAGLTWGNAYWNLKFQTFTTLATIVLLLDMLSHRVAAMVRPKASHNLGSRSPLRQKLDKMLFPIKFRTTRFLRKLQMERWTKWHGMETVVLLSFPLQYVGALFPSYNPVAVGVHWTYLFGLFRLAAASRVIHAVGCAENNLLLRRRQIDPQELSLIRMVKLITFMLVVIHVNACLWCIVARIQLGPGTMEPEPTDFFPKAEIFEGKLAIWNAYLHAVQYVSVCSSFARDLSASNFSPTAFL